MIIHTICSKSWTHNWTKGGRDNLYTEIRDNSTGYVWLCQTPMTSEEFQNLPLPEGFSKVAIGRAAHDLAYFTRSPDAIKDDPVTSMQIGNWTYAKVARPGSIDKKYLEQGYRNFILLNVHKYHKVMFKAGRTIEILTMEDGNDYVPNTTEAIGFAGNKTLEGRALPESWSIREVTLKNDLILEIPCPARVCFFNNGDGFHGPVQI